MEEPSQASIYVAPLHIVKSEVGLTITTETSAGSEDPLLQHNQHNQHNEMTPPPTPQDTDQPKPEPTQAIASTFPNYLRAFYPFQPSGSVSPTTITLPLSAGNLILVHSIHTNGWADGTLLDTGDRGWLPTNYCEEYEHNSMQPLLKALTDFWDVIRTRSNATLDPLHDQDYVRGLIAGVRFLLEKSSCLTRDAPIVKQHNNIRRTRKTLLSDLSTLVKAVKCLPEVGGERSTAPTDEILSNILLKAFKVVVRGVRFVDVWSEVDNLNRAFESVTEILGRAITHDGYHPLTPPADTLEDRHTPDRPPTSARSASALSRGSRKSTRRQTIGHEAPYSRPGTGQSTIREHRISFQNKRPSLSHRMRSGGDHTADPSECNFASQRLRSSHDVFLGCLGTFLGLHMQSRSPAELLLTTQQSVRSCRDLLAVIEIVLEHDFCRSETLIEAKDAMYDNITDLVEAAKEIFQPSSPIDDDALLMEDDKKLVRAARDCVRGAGECVAMTRSVLERIGDFEPEPSELQLSMPNIASPRSGPQTIITSSTSHPASTVAEESVSGQHEEPLDMDAPSTMSPASPLDRSFYCCSPPIHPVQGPIIVDISHDERPVSMEIIPTPSSTASIVIPDSELEKFEPIAPIASEISEEPFDAPFVARGLVNSTGTNSTYLSSTIDSAMTPDSQASTRATSPGAFSPRLEGEEGDSSLAGSFVSVTDVTDDNEETEAKLMEKTFAHELVYNKEGHIIGGSLPALVEKLTVPHSRPDTLFLSTFYLTFRLFASAQDFAEAMISRFNYVAEGSSITDPIRLRVANVLKGWLESHWRHDCDDAALPLILDFARHRLTEVLPTSGKTVTELAEKAAEVHGPVVPRLVSSIGKTNVANGAYSNLEASMPAPVISKNQLASLRTWKMGGPNVSILDFEALELARQITIKSSALFCSILPEELLATEWMKRSGSLAVNVRAMSTLSTDLANLVADSILMLEEPKKRSLVIKQWVKIAGKCLALQNYDSLMAIICALNSSTISRLKRTWELVSQKTHVKLENLRGIVEVSRNYIVLRQRLQGHVPPCLPFVGIYLTDLTFVDHGNQATRKLTKEDGSMEVINFDKHMKTAKIISELQRFQLPYRLTEIPELQTWMQDQLVRVRSVGEKSFQNHYRRSLQLEPKEQPQVAKTMPASSMKGLEFANWFHITTNG